MTIKLTVPLHRLQTTPLLSRNPLQFLQTRSSHVGKRPILFPKEVTAVLDETVLPKSDRFRGHRNFIITGPLGVQKVPIPPWITVTFEDPTEPSSSSESSSSSSSKSDDPNDLGDPTDIAGGARRAHLTILDSREKKQRQTWGTTQSLLTNAVTGVTEGYQLPLRINGVGYRAAMIPSPVEKSPPLLSMRVGFLTPTNLKVPKGIACSVPIPTSIMLSGIDKQKLGQFAAEIRRLRPPEPYKQKGIFVGDETIAKKVGKKGK